MWSVDPEDWKKPGASVVTSRLVSGATPGGILLVHDIHSSTIDAMPSTVDQLLGRGFQFVTVTQLIAMDGKG
jgi:peptidoglycan/xylan/chitin deacetylase (PgdA/CDA1 family)